MILGAQIINRIPNSDSIVQGAPVASLLLATIDIGEEIFVSYGAAYWRTHGINLRRNLMRKRKSARGNAASDLLNTVLSTFNSPLADAITQAAESDPKWAQALSTHYPKDSPFHSVNGHLYWNDRLCIPDDTKLRTQLIRECHDASISGHLGRDKTAEQLKRRFYWVGMDEEIRKYVISCDTCQRNKSSQQSPLGLLKPLPIPPRPWHTWSLDLITALPRSNPATMPSWYSSIS